MIAPCAGAESAGFPAASVGLNVQTLVDSGGRFDDGQVAALLTGMARDGLQEARSDVLWSYAEPGPPAGGEHRYDWTAADATAGALARAGIRWIPLLHGSPAWASTDPSSLFAAPAPGHEDDYAAMAAALVRRYGEGGTFWAAHPELPALPVRTLEVWNEENVAEHWGGPPDPAAYARLFAATRAAVKAAAPGVSVLVGGIVWNDDVAYLDGVLAALGDTPVDGVAIHPYAPTAASVLVNVRRMRAALDAAGRPGVPLVLSEVGWPAALDAPPSQHGADGPVSDAARAGAMALAVDAFGHSTCGVSAIQVYNAVVGTDAARVESSMGIYGADGSPTAPSRALWEAAARLRAAGADAAPPIPACGPRGASRTQLLPLQLTAAPAQNGCHLATVTYRGLPLEEAEVRVLQPYAGLVVTDASGQALVCPPKPGGNAGLRLAADVAGMAASNQAICDLPGGRCRLLGPAAACVLDHLRLAPRGAAVLGGSGVLRIRATGCSPQVGGAVRLRAAAVLPGRSAAGGRGLMLGSRSTLAAGRAVLRDPGGSVVLPVRLTARGRRALARARRARVVVQVKASEAGTADVVTAPLLVRLARS